MSAASCSCHLRISVPLFRDATSKICCLEHVSARVRNRQQFFKPAHYYSVPGGASSTTISHVIDTNGYKTKRSAGTDQWARQRRREHDSQEPLLACYSLYDCFVDLLPHCGDVESNPGPTEAMFQKIFDEIRLLKESSGHVLLGAQHLYFCAPRLPSCCGRSHRP
ncbi:hypothetical protein HPB48_008013 [Haemaphysalis longicornis]|uniref:Uncharacterized protein n=1 Tax=Haemaphysalis longicornis TaxID=44386 RepID=A0A9J6FAU3_HAELO|nr:hypothetical protein HPB48_008013 [Haemaphysalis longicornis]